MTEKVKMFLFARWMSMCYADEHLDENMIYTGDENYNPMTSMSVLNKESGDWWKNKLNFFESQVYPNYVKNGTVKKTEEFLKI